MRTKLFNFFEAALHRTLRYYELLHKDNVAHRIVKRGVQYSHHPYNVIEEIQFQTLGKDFRLILHPHREVLHSHFKAYTIDKDGNETIVHMGNKIYCMNFNNILNKYFMITVFNFYLLF